MSITLAAFTAIESFAAGSVVARWTVLARTGDVDGDLAALKIFVMELLNGFLGFLWRGKFNKKAKPRERPLILSSMRLTDVTAPAWAK